MSIFKWIRDEMRASLKLKFFWAMLVLVPLGLGLLIGFTFAWKRVPRDIPVAVWNRDNQNLSREFLRYVDSTQAFALTKSVTDMEAGKAFFVSGEVRGFIVIPPDFSKNLNTGKPAHVIFYQDFNYLLPGRTLGKAISKIETWEQEKWLRRFFENKGISGGLADFLKNPIHIEYKKMFNESMEYTQFILPALFTTFLFQVLFLIGGTAYFFIPSESIRSLSDSFPLKYLSIRIIVYLMLSIIPFIVTYGIVFPLFNCAMGNILILFVYYLLFTLATLLMGMLISALLRNQVMATEIIIGLGAVAFTLSGYTWPRYMFPALFDNIVGLYPLTSYLEESSKIWYKTGYRLSAIPLIILIFVYGVPLYFITWKRRSCYVKAS